MLCLTIVNTVIVKSNETGNNTSNASDNGTFIINSSADLSIIKNVNVNACIIGKTVIWVISVTNNGPDNAYNVKVTDNLPNSLKFISSSDPVNYNPISGIWTIGTLNNGKNIILTITTKVIKEGEITNIATVNSNSNDTNKANNKANKTIKVNPIVDLIITKISNKKTVYIGDKIVWTIKVKNNGPSKALNVYVTDKLPQGFKYISSSTKKGSYNKNTGKWNIGNLSCGESVILEIITKATKIGNYTNIASVNNTINDTNSSNNMDNVTVNVIKKENITPKPPEHDNNTKTNYENRINTLESTGNPLLIVLFTILVISGNIIRRKK